MVIGNLSPPIGRDPESPVDIVVNLIAGALGKGEFVVIKDFDAKAVDRIANACLSNAIMNPNVGSAPILLLRTQHRPRDKSLCWVHDLETAISERGRGIVTTTDHLVTAIRAYSCQSEPDYASIAETMHPYFIEYMNKRVKQYCHDLKTWVIVNIDHSEKYLESRSEEALHEFISSYTNVNKWRKAKSELDVLFENLDTLNISRNRLPALHVVDQQTNVLTETAFDNSRRYCEETDNKVKKVLEAFRRLDDISRAGVV